MPFGLCILAVFQHFMDEVFHNFRNKFVIIYLVDILIFSNWNLSHLEHISYVKLVLQWLRQNCLYAKVKTFHSHQSHLPFLGYIINLEGFQMDLQKLPACLHIKHLKRVSELSGIANYYRCFIKDFATIAPPLTDMTKKGEIVTYGPLKQCQLSST